MRFHCLSDDPNRPCNIIQFKNSVIMLGTYFRTFQKKSLNDIASYPVQLDFIYFLCGIYLLKCLATGKHHLKYFFCGRELI